MATLITKNSSTASSVPTNAQLVQGELAVNVTDKRLYTENASGTVVELGTNPGSAVTHTAGTAGAPAITTTGDTNTGIFFPAADTIAFSEGGVEALRLNSSGQIAASTDGTASVPVFTRSTDTNTGLFFPAADTVAASTGGAERLRLDPSGNLGLGGTPSAWISSGKAIDIGGFGSVAQTSSGSLASTFNAYQNSAGNWIYKTTNAAAQYQCGLAGLGQHAWFVATSGTAGNTISFTQAMTLDSSGNLLVGATSALFSSANRGNITVGGSASSILVLGTGATTCSYIYHDQSTGNAELWNGANSYLRFGTNNTERARITSGGYLLVGTTSGIVAQTGVTSTHNISTNVDTGFGLTVSNTSGGAFGLGIKYTAHSPNNAGNSFVWCSDGGGTQRASIYSNGGLANYSGNNVNLSDRREKTNFAPAKDYLDTICAIPVQTFNYIDQSEDDPGTTLGVVAQDVQAVAPELVMESNWGTKDDPKMRLSIYQTDLQYALMKCIQELKAELDSVKAELNALKGT